MKMRKPGSLLSKLKYLCVNIAVLHFSQGEPCSCLGMEAWSERSLREHWAEGMLAADAAAVKQHGVSILLLCTGHSWCQKPAQKAGGVGHITVLWLRDNSDPQGWNSGDNFQGRECPAGWKRANDWYSRYSLFKSFIFAGFEEHPSKLRPQMGWSELDLNLDFTLHICIHIHAHNTAASLIWETGLSCSWDRDQPWHCVPKSPHPYEL